MKGSKLDFQVWMIAPHPLSTTLKSVSGVKLHRDMSINQRSALFPAHRLRAALADIDGPFEEPVEADETHFQGKRANMSKATRVELADTGHVAVGKTMVLGVKNQARDRVAAKVVPSTKSSTLQSFVRDHAGEDAVVYTDEHRAYTGLAADNAHGAVNLSVGQYARGMAHTQGIKSFWSMLKRAHEGTFHEFSPEHFDQYVQEFAGKHNVCDADTIDILAPFAAGAVGKRLLHYRELIADNGLPSGARSA